MTWRAVLELVNLGSKNVWRRTMGVILIATWTTAWMMIVIMMEMRKSFSEIGKCGGVEVECSASVFFLHKIVA